MGLIDVRNDVFHTDQPGGSTHLTQWGSDWLWAVMAIMLISFLAYVGLNFKARHGELIFHYLFAIALLVGTICYFAMAADLGFSVVAEEFKHGIGATYQVFFAKYIFWVVAFPMLIIALGLTSGVSWATILYNVFLSWIWIISYLCAAYISTSYKWGFFVFGTIAFLVLSYQILAKGSASAKTLGLSKHYTMLAGWTVFLWFLYVIAFAISDGSNVISVNSMFVFFGILDLLLIPALAFAFLFMARSWDYETLNLNFTRYGRVRHAGGVFPEKNATAPRAGGVTGHGATGPQHGHLGGPQHGHAGGVGQQQGYPDEPQYNTGAAGGTAPMTAV